jgi:hypothetical protein
MTRMPRQIGITAALGAAAGAILLAYQWWLDRQEQPDYAGNAPAPEPPAPRRPAPATEVKPAPAAEVKPAPAAKVEPKPADQAEAKPAAAQAEPKPAKPAAPAAGELGGHAVPDVAALLAFVNTADEAALREAKIRQPALGTLLTSRPFASLDQLAATAGIGPKTLEALAAWRA